MLRKDEILERTNKGLNVFKHYISGTWRVGRNFLNPLYEDSKASCNIYFDRRNGTYKMKDFGNDSYSGDCFFFVGSKGWIVTIQGTSSRFCRLLTGICHWGFQRVIRCLYPNRLKNRKSLCLLR